MGKKHKKWTRRDKRAARFAVLEQPSNPRVVIGHNSGLSPSDLVTAGLLNLALEQAVTQTPETPPAPENHIDAGGSSDGFSGGGSTGEF